MSTLLRHCRRTCRVALCVAAVALLSQDARGDTCRSDCGSKWKQVVLIQEAPSNCLGCNSGCSANPQQCRQNCGTPGHMFVREKKTDTHYYYYACEGQGNATCGDETQNVTDVEAKTETFTCAGWQCCGVGPFCNPHVASSGSVTTWTYKDVCKCE